MTHPEKHSIEQIRQHLRHHVASIVGEADPTGYEIHELIHVLSNMQDAIIGRQTEDSPISGARLGILVHLLEEEENGNRQGVTPSSLSRHQNVSRNTISALLRGLEEQGFIERALDSGDRRTFRIHITEAGRQAVYRAGPQRVAIFDRLVSGLNRSEQMQLVELLAKLFNSMQANDSA